MIRILATIMVVFLATATQAEGVRTATYADPTDRYDHGILGDAIEFGALEMVTDTGRRLRLELPGNRVFEDIAPRVVDLDFDGDAEVVVIETDINLGARLAVYGVQGLIAATPNIGTTHRWLAPIGAADLDGDGTMEIAFVDRPHLARLIRIWTFKDGELTLADELSGFTNHRIGEDNIAGGIRDCGSGPEMIVADRNWQQVIAIGWADRTFSTNPVAPHRDRSSFAAVMACK